MQRRDKARLYFFLGLLASAILYSAYNLYILNPDVYSDMGRGIRHVYKFGSIIIAWLIGFVVLRQTAPAWLLHLWNILYAAGLALLLLLAGFDAAVQPLPATLRQPISTFHEAFISPIPYVVIGLLNWASFRK
jgi:hypothetical protein